MPADAPDDPFDDLLGLEDTFYKEGYDAGLADGEHAGLVEGRLFGIEKGYEKALELGRLHGRAVIWQQRHAHTDVIDGPMSTADIPNHVERPRLPKNNRLVKHIDGLLAVTDGKALSVDNSDESVTEFDDRLARANAKAKVIAAIVGEPLRAETTENGKGGIEESMGLNARH